MIRRIADLQTNMWVAREEAAGDTDSDQVGSRKEPHEAPWQRDVSLDSEHGPNLFIRVIDSHQQITFLLALHHLRSGPTDGAGC